MHILTALAHRLAELAPFFAIGLLLEAGLRARAVPIRHVLFNLACNIIFWGFHIAAGASFMAFVASLALTLPGAGLVPLPGGSTIGGLLVNVVLFVACRDFLYYWMHRLQHQSSWLWAAHELHHSDAHMNVTTAYRNHWLEYPLQAICIVAPFTYVFRVSLATVVVAGTVSDALALFVHLNARMGLGRWSWLVTTPQGHRIHHSIEPGHRDKNFAVVFPIWDVLFGTYYAPQPAEYPATGIASGEADSLVRAVTLPFVRWYARLSRRASAVSARDRPTPSTVPTPSPSPPAVGP